MSLRDVFLIAIGPYEIAGEHESASENLDCRWMNTIAQLFAGNLVLRSRRENDETPDTGYCSDDGGVG